MAIALLNASSLYLSWSFNLSFVIKLDIYFQVARPLLERSFHRKVQSRKIFTHRESFDTIIAKTEEKLSKVSENPILECVFGKDKMEILNRFNVGYFRNQWRKSSVMTKWSRIERKKKRLIQNYPPRGN